MIGRILLRDYLKSPRNLALKILLPFIVVFVSAYYGYATLALIMILIFTVVTGSGLKIVSLKTAKVFDRLLILPVSKRRLFAEYAGGYAVLYSVQLLPALLVGMWYSSGVVVVYALLSIFIIVIIGTLVGIHAKSYGEIHLFSLFAVIPLVGLALMKEPLSYMFPFVFVAYPSLDWVGLLCSSGMLLLMVAVLLWDVSRL